MKLITNYKLLNSTGNFVCCSVVTEMGRKSKKERIYVMHINDSLCCITETNTNV